jgi:hypothetical protein
MGFLFVISDEFSTAIKLASIVAKQGTDVSILFIGEAYKYAEELDLIEKINFTDDVFFLKENSKSVNVEGVETIGYAGWVELIEENEQIVSWN